MTSTSPRRSISRKIAGRLGHHLQRYAWPVDPQGSLGLSGDRDVEWSWALAHLPTSPKHVLDFGPGDFPLMSLVAARKGAQVTCFDVADMRTVARMTNISHLRGDISNYRFATQAFDTILNCSTVEHVGLGRYGDDKTDEGDILAMRLLREQLTPDGKMLLTIPVGRDAVHRPRHRVYGPGRLPLLLEGFRVLDSEFWAKYREPLWEQVSSEEAFHVGSTPTYYALGLFELEADLA